MDGMHALLELLFFREIDEGTPWQKTALFSGVYKNQPLTAFITKIMPQLSAGEIAALITECREEVRL